LLAGGITDTTTVDFPQKLGPRELLGVKTVENQLKSAIKKLIFGKFLDNWSAAISPACGGPTSMVSIDF
jgi:hypothetical protein